MFQQQAIILANAVSQASYGKRLTYNNRCNGLLFINIHHNQLTFAGMIILDWSPQWLQLTWRQAGHSMVVAGHGTKYKHKGLKSGTSCQKRDTWQVCSSQYILPFTKTVLAGLLISTEAMICFILVQKRVCYCYWSESLLPAVWSCNLSLSAHMSQPAQVSWPWPCHKVLCQQFLTTFEWHKVVE